MKIYSGTHSEYLRVMDSYFKDYKGDKELLHSLQVKVEELPSSFTTPFLLTKNI